MPSSTGRQTPSTKPSTSSVGSTSPLLRMTTVRYSGGTIRDTVLVGDEHAVPHRQETRRRRRVLRRHQAIRNVVHGRAAWAAAPRPARHRSTASASLTGGRYMVAELGDIRHRRGPEALEVPAHQQPHRGRHVARARLTPRSDVGRPSGRTPTGPRSWHARTARTGGGPTRSAASASRSAASSQRSTSALVRGDAVNSSSSGTRASMSSIETPSLREPAIVQASRTQRHLHRLVEDCVVVGGNGMQRDPQRLRLHDALLGEGGVEVRGIAIEPTTAPTSVTRSALGLRAIGERRPVDLTSAPRSCRAAPPVVFDARDCIHEVASTPAMVVSRVLAGGT